MRANALSQSPIPLDAPTGRGHILLVDDDAVQLRLARGNLIAEGYEVSTAACPSDALQIARARKPHAIISDVQMDELDGFGLCSVFCNDAELSGIPIILITAHVNSEDDRRLAIATGARSLVQRTPDFHAELSALKLALDHATHAGRPERWNAEPYIRRMAAQMAHLLAKSQATEARYRRLLETVAVIDERYRSLVQSIPGVEWSATLDGSITFVSPHVSQVCGYSDAELIAGSLWFERTHPDDLESVRRGFDNIAGGYDQEYRWQRKDGEWIWIRVRASVRVDPSGHEFITGTLADISEQRRLQDQVRESQKLEAIGQLTGGIAHDFNNILAVIIGNGELLKDDLPEADPRRADVDAILEAGERAAALTRQLLAFSRRDVLKPRILDLNQTVRGLEKMLHRVIGEDIQLTASLDADLGHVRADTGQIEQVIMNLVVNARDAMPKGGRVCIETRNVGFDGTCLSHDEPMAAGDYVAIAVTDTGCGMTAETRSHIFEPFFTTKGIGKGTGLGLSTCYRIVQQSGGFIRVTSVPERGSVFTVYLPRVE